MTKDIFHRQNTASAAQIAEHLALCDEQFIPLLSSRVDLVVYASKLASRAQRFEAWSGQTLAGLVAVYMDSGMPRAYITNVSVLPEWSGRGVAKNLLGLCIAHARAAGTQEIGLEVDVHNVAAVALYERVGFRPGRTTGRDAAMTLKLRTCNQ
jgi:ribosomal protein S18 acetylase RimI-like enzyme